MKTKRKQGKADRIAEIAAKMPAPTVRFSDGETYYTMQGVAQLLGLHRVTIWRLVRQGKMQGARVGREVYIRESAVKALLAHGEDAAARATAPKTNGDAPAGGAGEASDPKAAGDKAKRS